MVQSGRSRGPGEKTGWSSGELESTTSSNGIGLPAPKRTYGRCSSQHVLHSYTSMDENDESHHKQDTLHVTDALTLAPGVALRLKSRCSRPWCHSLGSRRCPAASELWTCHPSVRSFTRSLFRSIVRSLWPACFACLSLSACLPACLPACPACLPGWLCLAGWLCLSVSVCLSVGRSVCPSICCGYPLFRVAVKGNQRQTTHLKGTPI